MIVSLSVQLNSLELQDKQQGFVDISGRRRARSEVEAGDQDEELEQPIVTAGTATIGCRY